MLAQLYVALRYWSAPSSLTALVTLYGYSLVIYVPLAVRCPPAWQLPAAAHLIYEPT